MDEQMSNTWSLHAKRNQSATRTYTVLCYNVHGPQNQNVEYKQSDTKAT